MIWLLRKKKKKIEEKVKEKEDNDNNENDNKEDNLIYNVDDDDEKDLPGPKTFLNRNQDSMSGFTKEFKTYNNNLENY